MSPNQKQITACDELGRKWIVYENDTAWGHCSRLSKKGLTQIVLPFETFLTGQLLYPQGLLDVNSLPVEVVRDGGEAVKEVVRRQIRMADCLKFLEEEANVQEEA